MAYTIVFNAYAARTFRKLPRPVQQRMRPVIDALQKEPRPPGAEKIAGTLRAFRIRIGSYQVIYEIHDSVLLVLVSDMGHRREVYRQH